MSPGFGEHVSVGRATLPPESPLATRDATGSQPIQVPARETVRRPGASHSPNDVLPARDGSAASAGRLADLGSHVGDDLAQPELCRVICQLVEQFLRGRFELRGGVGIPLVSGSDEVAVRLGVGLPRATRRKPS
jgi:hypothetical protein